MDSNKTIEIKNKKLFGRWAAYYDSNISRGLFFERTYQHIVNIIKRDGATHLVAGASVLDVACGTGEIIHRLVPFFPDVSFVGADLTPAMVRKAQEKNNAHANVRFLEANAVHLPFPQEMFSLVICSDAFHHFADQTQTLREIHRVMKEGGIFLLVDPMFNNSAIHFFGNTIIRKLEHATRYYSRQEMEHVLQANEFTLVATEKHAYNTFFLCKKKKR